MEVHLKIGEIFIRIVHTQSLFIPACRISFCVCHLPLSILWESSLMLTDGLKRTTYGYFSFYLRTNHHGFPWRLKARFVDYLSEVEHFNNVAFWISWIKVMIWAFFERHQSVRRGGKQENEGKFTVIWSDWTRLWYEWCLKAVGTISYFSFYQGIERNGNMSTCTNLKAYKSKSIQKKVTFIEIKSIESNVSMGHWKVTGKNVSQVYWYFLVFLFLYFFNHR